MAIDDYVAHRASGAVSNFSASSNHFAEVDEFASEMMAYTVSEFIAHCNLALEQTFPLVYIEGEVASFKVNQRKWVFFDLKEENESVSCFMPLAKLTFPIMDGMKVRLRAAPKLTRRGKFSLVVDRIIPLGEGNLKKSLELLRQKLTKEGLFDPAKKRPLPEPLQKIGVISSTDAAGYADFLKILDARWGGLQILTAHVQVQGLAAPEQIIRALNYFNQHSDVDVIAILRGGGSADDLAAFNDEALVRAVAASRIPTITGIGHEIDESLVDLAADLRASTPSNAAELLTPDKKVVSAQISAQLEQVFAELTDHLAETKLANREQITQLTTDLFQKLQLAEDKITAQMRLLSSLNPEQILKRGYALLSGKLSPGELINITTYQSNIQAEVKHVAERHP